QDHGVASLKIGLIDFSTAHILTASGSYRYIMSRTAQMSRREYVPLLMRSLISLFGSSDISLLQFLLALRHHLEADLGPIDPEAGRARTRREEAEGPHVLDVVPDRVLAGDADLHEQDVQAA